MFGDGGVRVHRRRVLAVERRERHRRLVVHRSVYVYDIDRAPRLVRRRGHFCRPTCRTGVADRLLGRANVRHAGEQGIGA